ncbi:MAG: hypothetical protein LUP94_02525 [Candidatus Methanomethylicus sp.]|nr:hypothetical protein [Candidatus Methanomethylicus sp.]
MATNVITEAIITIAVVVVASTAAFIFMQGSLRLNGAQLSAINDATETVSTSIKVIFATNSSQNIMKAWVKNTGQSQISPNALSDFNVFFGPRGNFSLMIFNQTLSPTWNYSLVNNGDSDLRFDPGETIEITLLLPYSISPGDYYLKIITSNGVNAEFYFAV